MFLFLTVVSNNINVNNKIKTKNEKQKISVTTSVRNELDLKKIVKRDNLNNIYDKHSYRDSHNISPNSGIIVPGKHLHDQNLHYTYVSRESMYF